MSGPIDEMANSLQLYSYSKH